MKRVVAPQDSATAFRTKLREENAKAAKRPPGTPRTNTERDAAIDLLLAAAAFAQKPA